MFCMFMIWFPYWKVDGMVVVLQLDKKAAKPVTTVQDCVTTFVTLKEQDHSVFYIYGSVTPLNTFTGELGMISSLICGEKKQKTGIFNETVELNVSKVTSEHLLPCLCGPEHVF